MKTLYVILATILLAIPLAVLMIFNLPGLIMLSAMILVAIPLYRPSQEVAHTRHEFGRS